MRIAYVVHRYHFHASHSGYDRILDLLPPGDVLRPESLRAWASPLPDRVSGHVRDLSGVATYGRSPLLAEVRASIPFLFGPPCTFYYVYGDLQYRFLAALPGRRRHRLVATFHRPPSVLAQQIEDPRFLAKLDHGILLGRSQLPFFRPHLADERLSVIPHGIDTDFFSPGADGPREDLGLFIDGYQRDAGTLRRTVLRVTERSRTTRFIVVTRPQRTVLFSDLPRTEVRSGVSDEELRLFYRRASVLVLPMLDAVGNNSILEAMACGLPVVATDVGSIREYMDETSGLLAPTGNDHALAESALSILHDASRIRALSAGGRRLAVERFDWKVVAPKVARVLERVGTAPPATPMPEPRRRPVPLTNVDEEDPLGPLP